jgi:hypothetical protein
MMLYFKEILRLLTLWKDLVSKTLISWHVLLPILVFRLIIAVLASLKVL